MSDERTESSQEGANPRKSRSGFDAEATDEWKPSDSPDGPDDGSDGSRMPNDAPSSAAQEEIDKYLSLAKRTQAEFENFQKRVARDREQERKYAVQPLAADLLSALDNLDRALEAASTADEPVGLMQGVQMVRKELLDALARHGVERVDPIGQPFDPHLHEALSQFPSPDHEPMTVLQVVRMGYKLHDRVIRPAHVIVSSAPA